MQKKIIKVIVGTVIVAVSSIGGYVGGKLNSKKRHIKNQSKEEAIMNANNEKITNIDNELNNNKIKIEEELHKLKKVVQSKAYSHNNYA